MFAKIKHKQERWYIEKNKDAKPELKTYVESRLPNAPHRVDGQGTESKIRRHKAIIVHTTHADRIRLLRIGNAPLLEIR